MVCRAANPKLGYDSHVIVQWEGGPVGDMVADAVIAVILQTGGEPLAVAEAEKARQKAVEDRDLEAAVCAELQMIAALMQAHFGNSAIDTDNGVVRLEIDGTVVVIDHKSSKVHCTNDDLKARIEKALVRVTEAMKPCTTDFEM